MPHSTRLNGVVVGFIQLLIRKILRFLFSHFHCQNVSLNKTKFNLFTTAADPSKAEVNLLKLDLVNSHLLPVVNFECCHQVNCSSLYYRQSNMKQEKTSYSTETNGNFYTHTHTHPHAPCHLSIVV